MTIYRVTWIIDIDADSPEAAAREALDIQHSSRSIATVFMVEDTDTHTKIDIDLANCEGTENGN